MTGSKPDLATTATPPSPYGRFAQAYAAGAERRFSETMARFALREIEQEARKCRSVADVACGLGAACEYFAERGMRVIGVDASADMLHQARTAAVANGLHIDYLQQDMRGLSLPEPVDLVTCMYDSLNFMITRDDLRQAFQQVRSALHTGGHYLFDMYTLRGLAECWGATDQIHTVEATHFVATRTSWNPHSQTSTKHLWGFDRDGQSWNRWEEQHTVRAYPLDEIETALMSTNFWLLRTYDWTGTTTGRLTKESTRAVFLAKAT